MLSCQSLRSNHNPEFPCLKFILLCILISNILFVFACFKLYKYIYFWSWWWTGRPGVLRFMGSQRVGHDWATDLIWSDLIVFWDLRFSLSMVALRFIHVITNRHNSFIHICVCVCVCVCVGMYVCFKYMFSFYWAFMVWISAFQKNYKLLWLFFFMSNIDHQEVL